MVSGPGQSNQGSVGHYGPLVPNSPWVRSPVGQWDRVILPGLVVLEALWSYRYRGPSTGQMSRTVTVPDVQVAGGLNGTHRSLPAGSDEAGFALTDSGTIRYRSCPSISRSLCSGGPSGPGGSFRTGRSRHLVGHRSHGPGNQQIVPLSPRPSTRPVEHLVMELIPWQTGMCPQPARMLRGRPTSSR